jgi:glycosyltransferase involved in cell wall biosynthesis
VHSGVDASVVIPTRDRAASLARCLTALERQTSTGTLEILVVDDGSRDLTRVIEAVGGSQRARLVRGQGNGPAAARNRGASEARGRTLLFIDDDCEPSPDWADILVGVLARGADAAAGRTVNGRPEDRFAEASQTIANYLHDWSNREGLEIFAASNNLACTADAFSRVRFDEGFRFAGGEDRDWCSRLAAAGLTLVAEHAAVVVHRQKLSFGRFLRQQFNYGRGAYLFRRRRGSTGQLAPSSFYRGLVGAGFERGRGVGVLVCLAQLATAGGYALAALEVKRGRTA